MLIDTGNTRYKKVLITKSDGTMVVGWINVQVKNRVSDFINDEKKFVVLVLNPQDEKKKSYIINKDYIIQIEPFDE